MQKESQILAGRLIVDHVLIAATGGSQVIRFERFKIQASGSAGGIDL